MQTQMPQPAKPKQADPAPPAIETATERKMRLLAKVKHIREFRSKMGAVKGSPDKEYCWVNLRDDRQFAFQASGWELCTDPNVQAQGAKRLDDGTLRRADVILYQIDRELYEALEADKALRGIAEMEDVEVSFETNAERIGARTFRPAVA